MLVVMIGWVFFRAETLTGAIGFLKAMAGMGIAAPTPYSVRWFLKPDLLLAIAAGVIGSAPWVKTLADRIAASNRSALAWSASLASVATLVVLLVASILQVASGTYNPFIYFRF